jgi:hypothetical protein
VSIKKPGPRAGFDYEATNLEEEIYAEEDVD